MALKGMKYLKDKLEKKRPRTDLRYRYYDMKNSVTDCSKLLPEDMRWISAVLGWCGKSVDALADRLSFTAFRNDNFDMNGIFQLNNPDILTDSAIVSALIPGCCFLYISADEEGFPRLQVITGDNATGVIDPITYMMTEGYAVLERSSTGTPQLEAYFTPGRTWFYDKKAGRSWSVGNDAPYALLVPVIYRPDARRPFGHSRISRACMTIMQGALRTIRRSEISAEFYSFPQKYALGLADDAEFDSRRATMSDFLSFGKDEDGDTPKIGQFSQQDIRPFIDQLRMFAALFAGETGLTLDDLGFVQDNPSSSEAIRAAHESLRLTAAAAQRSFGTAFLNAGYLAACVRDGFPYRREQIYQTKPVWKPAFAPDAASIGLLGDAVIKINGAVPGFITPELLQELTGIGPEV